VSATPITASTRYYRQGISKVIFCPTLANYRSPTRAEINVGTDLSGEVNAASGWEVTGNTEATNALGSVFTGNVPSNTEAGASSLTMYADRTSNDVRTLLSRGVTGNIIWMDEGDVAGQAMDIFPVQVTSAPKGRDVTALGMITANFATTREPAENVTIPV
jgi:hypothetical protein